MLFSIIHLSLLHLTVHDPISAPVSPSILRRASSQAESEDHPKANLRSGRRKLGSRHGWALGRGRGVSQSFSPGDQHTQPRIRLRSSQPTAAALWEHDGSPTPSHDSLSEEGRGEDDYIKVWTKWTEKIVDDGKKCTV